MGRKPAGASGCVPFTRPCSSSIDLVGQLADRTVMRRHHERHARVDECAHAVHHELPRLGVELRGGLVRDHDRRAGHDRLRERGALLLAAGELVRQVVDPVADAEPVEDLASSAAPEPREASRRCCPIVRFGGSCPTVVGRRTRRRRSETPEPARPTPSRSPERAANMRTDSPPFIVALASAPAFNNSCTIAELPFVHACASGGTP